MHGSLLSPKQRRVEQPENHPEMKREIIRAQPSIWSFKMFLFAGVWIQPLNIA